MIAEKAVGFQQKQQGLFAHHSTEPIPFNVGAVDSGKTDVYGYYRAFLSTMINMNSPTLISKVFICNNLYNTGMSGMHEKFIHYGRSVADLSIGQLEYPWYGADADKSTELPLLMFDRRAAGETNQVVANKLWAISQFIRTLPNLPRIFFYKSQDGSVVSITLLDEYNGIKFNYMPTEVGV